MSDIEEYDEMKRKALRIVARSLKNQRHKIIWTIPQELTDEQIQNHHNSMREHLIRMVILMIFILFLEAIVFLKFSLEGEINEEIMEYIAMLVPFIIIFVLTYKVYLSTRAITKEGWRKIEYNFYINLGYFSWTPNDCIPKSTNVKKMDEFPHAFPLPTYPTEQDIALQQYIHQQIEDITGLPIAKQQL